jgi:hypothetical protein
MATGGYSFTHFYGNDFSGVAFIGSSQFTVQGGYNRTLMPHTQIAAVYGYQDFDFTVIGTAFHSHVIQGMYGHRLSGRMDLLLGAGPQFTEVATPCTVFDALGGNPHCSLGTGGVAVGSIPNTKLGVAAQARLRYRLSRNSLDLRYERFVTSGGGLFAGAESDMVRFGLEHPLSRVWNLSLDVGVSRNNRLQPLTADQLAACNSSTQTPQSACPARNATTSIDGYAGAALHRYFGRTFHGFLSYQFSELSFDHSYCVPGLPCDHISNRHVVTFGLDWTPRPIRID